MKQTTAVSGTVSSEEREGTPYYVWTRPAPRNTRNPAEIEGSRAGQIVREIDRRQEIGLDRSKNEGLALRCMVKVKLYWTPS